MLLSRPVASVEMWWSHSLVIIQLLCDHDTCKQKRRSTKQINCRLPHRVAIRTAYRRSSPSVELPTPWPHHDLEQARSVK